MEQAPSQDVPVASVIVPAHNEANVLGRLLTSLPTHWHGRKIQIIVACNGCTDNTAEVARRHGATVVEVSKASKIAALNEADSIAVAFPRLYVDADLVLTHKTIHDLIEALSGNDLLCAAPPYHLEVAGRPLLVRAYFRVWLQVMSLRSEYVGSGIYSLSRKGRARFDRFPNVIADDTYVRNLFTRGERKVIDTDPTIVEAPWTLKAVFRRRIRVSIGNLELLARSDNQNHIAQQRSSPPWWHIVVSKPWLLPSAVVFALLNASAEFVARRRFRTVRAQDWGRDDTTRTNPAA